MKIVSVKYESQGDEQGFLCGKLSDGVDWEMVAVEYMEIWGAHWSTEGLGRGWFELFLAGQKRSCTK